MYFKGVFSFLAKAWFLLTLSFLCFTFILLPVVEYYCLTLICVPPLFPEMQIIFVINVAKRDQKYFYNCFSFIFFFFIGSSLDFFNKINKITVQMVQTSQNPTLKSNVSICT